MTVEIESFNYRRMWPPGKSRLLRRHNPLTTANSGRDFGEQGGFVSDVVVHCVVVFAFRLRKYRRLYSKGTRRDTLPTGLFERRTHFFECLIYLTSLTNRSMAFHSASLTLKQFHIHKGQSSNSCWLPFPSRVLRRFLEVCFLKFMLPFRVSFNPSLLTWSLIDF